MITEHRYMAEVLIASCPPAGHIAPLLNVARGLARDGIGAVLDAVIAEKRHGLRGVATAGER